MKCTGRAEVVGLGSFVITHGSLGANSALNAESVDTQHSWTETVTREPLTGKPIGLQALDEMKTCTVTCKPVAASSAASNTKAIAAGACVLPEPYALVTISGCNIASLNDTWLYSSGGQIQLASDGSSRLVLPLRRYAECDDTEHGYLSTQVS
jgi:hypothetical protein